MLRLNIRVRFLGSMRKLADRIDSWVDQLIRSDESCMDLRQKLQWDLPIKPVVSLGQS